MNGETLESLLDRFGMDTRRVYDAIALLQEETTIEEVVEETALSRRTIEQLIRSLGHEIRGVDGRYQIKAAYRERYEKFRVADSMADTADLLRRFREIVRRVPKPIERLDHVQATPESVLSRAFWLRQRFDLSGRRISFVGDHDLTSVALALVEPTAKISVVDIDERLLEFLAEELWGLGVSFDLRFGDLRFGAPEDMRATSDGFVTDPPYTPEGVALFASRGFGMLRDWRSGRGMIAYGYGEQLPTLGLKVQQALGGLDLLFEEIVPRFSRYRGAQAVGSASDWYVVRPTSGTSNRVDRFLTDLSEDIYTRGADSLESAKRPTEQDLDVLNQIVDRLAIDKASTIWVGDAELTEMRTTKARLQHFISGPPATRSARPRSTDTLMIDLRDDPGFWLYRVLLNTNCARVVLLVDNRHPDIGSKATQDQLKADFASKYDLRFYRSFPNSRTGLVVATRTIEENLSRIVAQALQKVKNAARETLIANAGQRGLTMSKNDARALLDPLFEVLGVGEALVRDCSRASIRAIQEAIDRANLGQQ